jgi:membrane protein involved in colicin uptake
VALRAEEETRQIAEAEARRLAALEAARVAAERARQHEGRLRKEEQARQIAEAAKRAENEARKAAEEIDRAAAEKAVRDAAHALARQLEEHKALTAAVTPASTREASGETALGAAETETAAVITGSDSPPAVVEATAPEAIEPSPSDRGPAVPTLEEAMSAPAPIAEMFDPRRKGTARKPRRKKDGAPAS